MWNRDWCLLWFYLVFMKLARFFQRPWTTMTT